MRPELQQGCPDCDLDNCDCEDIREEHRQIAEKIRTKTACSELDARMQAWTEMFRREAVAI